jgi:hypothetical protein
VAIDRDDVQAFLEGYGRALLAGDVDAVVDTYGRPGLVVGGDGVVAFTDRGEVEAAFRDLAERYRASGLATAVPAIEAFDPLGDAVAAVDVVWNTREADGRPGPHERFHYLVRHDGDHLAIHVVVPHATS